MKKLLLVLFICLCLVYCGSESPTTPPPPPPPPTITTTVIGEGSTSISSETFVLQRGSTGTRGELKANVNWSVAEATLWMYLADSECTVEEFQKDVCPLDPACKCEFLDRSEAAGPKPRRLSVPDFGPAGFAFIVWNVGDVGTNSSWQLSLTTTSATTLRPLPGSQKSGIEGFETAAKRPPS